MAEKYTESILMRKDNIPDGEEPLFSDDDCDAVFEFEGTVKLKQILKSIQNDTHNKHDYVFQIISINKMQKEEG